MGRSSPAGANTARGTLLLLGGIILPNLPFALVGMVLAFPPRQSALCLYGAVALIAGRIPRWAVLGLSLGALAIDATLLIAQMFFLDLDAVARWMWMLPDLRLMASPFYAMLLIALAAVAGTNLAYLWHFAPAMRGGDRRVAAIVLAALLLADGAGTGMPALGLGGWSARGFDAATARSGFGEAVRGSGTARHALLVLVESLGEPRAAAHRDALFASFDDPALNGAFTVQRGTVPFWGATTQGEMRELCLTRNAYRTVVGGARPECLPAALTRQGVRTLAVHGFSSDFYQRRDWYGPIGFAETLFLDSLTDGLARRCGGTFRGACDPDLGALIRARMDQAREPLFVYWLTLNSHVPVRPGEATRRFACETGGPFGDPEVCAMAEVWIDVFEAVKRLALEHPNAEILLVGDHAPPLWRRSARALFAPDRVPWIRLSPRAHPGVAG
ncbi:sulfatase-like hydrolase/transferase [Methylobacterium sp. JK268]